MHSGAQKVAEMDIYCTCRVKLEKMTWTSDKSDDWLTVKIEHKTLSHDL